MAARLVRLTDRGLEAYRVAGTIITELERRWSDEMGAGDFPQLKILLARLCDAIESTDP
jgi:hypothetical protein